MIGDSSRQTEGQTDTTNLDRKYRSTENTDLTDRQNRKDRHTDRKDSHRKVTLVLSLSLCPFFSKIKDKRSKLKKSFTIDFICTIKFFHLHNHDP